MARFRLREKHYLQVPGTEWEYRETGSNGKQKRIVVPVPLYLDPSDPSDWNYKADQVIIVSTKEDPAHPNDIVFTGKPTADMEPLDDEAKQMVNVLSPAWVHPIESLSPTGQHQSYGDQILRDLQKKIDALGSSSGVTPDKIVSDLQAQVAALTAQVQALVSASALGKAPSPSIKRSAA